MQLASQPVSQSASHLHTYTLHVRVLCSPTLLGINKTSCKTTVPLHHGIAMHGAGVFQRKRGEGGWMEGGREGGSDGGNHRISFLMAAFAYHCNLFHVMYH